MNLLTTDSKNYTIEGYPSQYNRFPTGNCQLGIIKHFCQMFEKEKNNKKLLEYIKTISQKPLILVDIHQSYTSRINELNKLCNDNLVILQTNYISSNKFLMMIVIFDTREITYE